MKKIVIIYSLGVIIGWCIGFNHIKHNNKRKRVETNISDVVFCSGMSLLSWVNVISLTFLEIGECNYLSHK